MSANTTIRNNELFCLNCGGSYKLKYPILVDELTKTIEVFNGVHKNCSKTWSEPEADQSQNIETRAYSWLENGERGMSSEAIWFCCMGRESNNKRHPLDPDDFKRCYKLFRAVPEWRQLHYVKLISAMSPQWDRLMQNWDKLTEMYEENVRTNWKRHKEIGMYDLMQKLIS